MRRILLFSAVVGAALLVVVVRVGLRLCATALSAWGAYLTGVGTLIIALAACATGILAVREYGERTKVEKERAASEQVRWTFQLFQQFFQDDRYRAIRQELDYDDLKNIVPLMARDISRDEPFGAHDRKRLDDFTDFLNFFEMIGYMVARGQISREDVDQVFDYYLRRMTSLPQSSELLRYLKEMGFENLRALLLQYSGEKSG